MWHGDALSKLLEGVDENAARMQPVAGAHSIWELVLHIAAWAEIVQARLGEHVVPAPTMEQNFPPVPSATARNWTAAQARLVKSYDDLARVVEGLGDSDLSRKVPGKRQTVHEMLHGVIEHGTYHGGQIAILKRALSL